MSKAKKAKSKRTMRLVLIAFAVIIIGYTAVFLIGLAIPSSQTPEVRKVEGLP